MEPLSKAELKHSFGRTTKQVFIPSGNLLIVLNAHYSSARRMEEKPRKRHIDNIPAILKRFEAAAALAEEREAASRKFKEDFEREKLVVRCLDILEENEAARWRMLREAAADQNEVEILKDAIETIRKRMAGHSLEQHPRTKAWLQWAEDRIARLDVLTAGPEELFEQLIQRGAEHNWEEKDQPRPRPEWEI